MKKIWIMGLLGIGMCSSCQENYQEKFIRIAQAENAACPRRLNETIVMDSTRYDAQRNVVHYYYTLSGAMDDTVYMKENTALHKTELQKAVFNLLETQEYVKHGTGFHIVYHSSSTGAVLAEFSF